MRLTMLAVAASLILAGCVKYERYNRDMYQSDKQCDKAMELFGELCKQELIRQKKDKGLRF